MAMPADRPGANAGPRSVTLRIKRGAKVLSDVKIGRSRVLVGSGSQAQLRLKNAGLAEECLVLDTRSQKASHRLRIKITKRRRFMKLKLFLIGDIAA